MYLVKQLEMFHGQALHFAKIGRAHRLLKSAEKALAKHERAVIVDMVPGKNYGKFIRYGKAGPAACLGIRC